MLWSFVQSLALSLTIICVFLGLSAILILFVSDFINAVRAILRRK